MVEGWEVICIWTFLAGKRVYSSNLNEFDIFDSCLISSDDASPVVHYQALYIWRFPRYRWKWWIQYLKFSLFVKSPQLQKNTNLVWLFRHRLWATSCWRQMKIKIRLEAQNAKNNTASYSVLLWTSKTSRLEYGQDFRSRTCWRVVHADISCRSGLDLLLF